MREDDQEMLYTRTTGRGSRRAGRTTRRTTAVCAAALSVCMVLAGCSSDDGDGDGGSSEGASSGEGLVPDGEGVTEYPLTIETEYGETELEARPERIAVVGGAGDLEVALSLGVSPVIVPQEADTWEYWEPYAGQFEDAVVMNPWNDYSAETIAAEDPDLIVASSLVEISSEFSDLSDIAPVVAVDLQRDNQQGWEDLTVALGEALDLPGRAEKVVDDTHESVEALREAHPEFEGTTVALIVNRGADIGVELTNSAGSPAEALLTDLGFAPHPNAEEVTGEDGWADISLENLGLIDADVILVGQHGGEGTPEEGRTWLEGQSIYQGLTAVEGGRVIQVPEQESGTLPLSWALAYPNPV
ncbi:MAG: ABC transporter substrate-binding protein, partial [Candidatus Corynebacterium faecigallinarum]